VLLPNSYPAVFSLCAVNKRSVVKNSIIQIMVIKYEVFVRNQLYLDYLNKHWCQEVHLPYGSDRVLEITV